jgi:hypothetical protein
MAEVRKYTLTITTLAHNVDDAIASMTGWIDYAAEYPNVDEHLGSMGTFTSVPATQGEIDAFDWGELCQVCGAGPGDCSHEIP